MSVALDAGTLLDELESGAFAARRRQARLGDGRGRRASWTPSAIAAGSRLASDRWFCWEQPDRGFALAGLGTAAEVVSRGEDRFATWARAAPGSTHDRVAEEPTGCRPARAGLVHRPRLRPGRRQRADLVVAAARPGGAAGDRDRPQRGPLVRDRLGRPGAGGLRTRCSSGWRAASARSARRRSPRPIRIRAPPRRSRVGTRPSATSGSSRRRSIASARARSTRSSWPASYRRGAGRTRPGRQARRPPRPLPGLLLLLLRHAGGRFHRRQPRAAGAPLRRRRGNRGAGRDDLAQRRPGRRRPPRRGDAAQPQGPRRARHRRAADRADAAPALGLGARRARAVRRSRSATSSTWRRRSAPSWPNLTARSSWRVSSIRRRRSGASRVSRRSS